MKKLINYPSIEQFRNVIHNINHKFNYIGQDENGDPIYDPTFPKPVVKFKGTVKLHGTNASVAFNNVAGMWVQSRNGIITPEKDNAGFAAFVEQNKGIFLSLLQQAGKGTDLDNNTVVIFGEWAGGSIQKGVGISNIEKSFFIFGLKIAPFEEEETINYWLDSSNLSSPDNRIYNIEDFETFEIDIDFNMPQLVQNTLGEITERIEAECPVAKSFGHSGVGEGIVWSATVNGKKYQMKVKGEKHSVSKVKTLASVDVDKLNSINEFVDYAVTDTRIDQAIENVFPDKQLDIKKLGDVIRWVVNDVMKEEMDTMISNNIEPKEVNKYISNKTRNMFFTIYNSGN